MLKIPLSVTNLTSRRQKGKDFSFNLLNLSIMEDVLVPLSAFATIFGVFYLFLMTRNRERMALIEKGADASLFNTGKKITWGSFALVTGMLFLGIGLGVIAAAIIASTTVIREDVAYPSMIFLFAGAGLVYYFFLSRKLNKKED